MFGDDAHGQHQRLNGARERNLPSLRSSRSRSRSPSPVLSASRVLSTPPPLSVCCLSLGLSCVQHFLGLYCCFLGLSYCFGLSCIQHFLGLLICTLQHRLCLPVCLVKCIRPDLCNLFLCFPFRLLLVRLCLCLFLLLRGFLLRAILLRGFLLLRLLLLGFLLLRRLLARARRPAGVRPMRPY